MRKISGVATGIVTSLEDPEAEARIQVSFPWLDGEYRSSWAPIAFPMAGKSRGMFFMPEVDDEVLVAFEHGDMDHPYIIGFLWNGVDVPPDDGINASVRRLRTVSGHVVEFDDRPGQEMIRIKTKGEQLIELVDLDGSITVKTKNGQEIKLVDLPISKISVHTTANNSIEISDIPPKISISAPVGLLDVTCLQATVNSTALLNINAPITVFNGVVQTPTLIAQAVVGAAYTPAPGNTFGL
jgi:phage baseplate assembly protein gpV